MEEIGTGVLDWDREERISDRYGSVMLLDRPQSYQKPLFLCRCSEGKYGRLLAMVREVREPAHIGDLFHEVYPSKPNVGDVISLGEGKLFFSEDRVGLLPVDNRSSLWLDINGLYRVHNQTVTLFFDDREIGAEVCKELQG